MTARMLVRDIETRSTVDLKKVGLYNYATHPSTEVLCIGYGAEQGPIGLWWPGDPVPPVISETARDPRWTAVAHNAPFELAIERHILHRRHGFPILPIERNVCTMAVANALGLPASLDKLAPALGLANQKDKVGSRLMLQMIKPRRARKHEQVNGSKAAVYWFEDDERMRALGAYCQKDVETAREAALAMPWLSDTEYAVWLLDQKINSRGIQIDQALALAAQKISQAAQIYFDDELNRITNGQVTATTQIAALTRWLGQYIDNMASLDKSAIEELLRLDLHPLARQAIELRAYGAQAAAKKVDALLTHCDSHSRVHNAFVYHAAGTGRWASRGVQLHNMKRSSTEDIEQAINVIGSGDFEVARKAYRNPLSVIGDLVRAMICAAPGHVLIGADFSGIEARITAWLASEESKLETFRAFDRKEGPDPYIIAAALIFGVDADQLALEFANGKPDAREKRQVGKASELAFGFAGGVGAYRKFDPNTEFTDDEIQRIKNAWRKAHPAIESMWDLLHTGAGNAVRQPGKRYTYRHKLWFEADKQSLRITLPSGRQLNYPEARMARIITPKDSGLVIVSPRHPDSQRALIFKDNESGRWHDVKTWRGLWTENVVQAIARDLLAEAMLRLDVAGFNIVAHVHDEVIAEVKIADAERLKRQFHALMTELPEWATGLPVVAKLWCETRYVK